MKRRPFLTTFSGNFRQAHSELIKKYLLTQPQRLFGLLVIGVYGGEPEWCEVSVQKAAKSQVSDEEIGALKGILGFPQA